MSKNTYNFFAYISRMKYIYRWGLMRNTRQENLHEHSLDVAIIAHALGIIGNTYFNRNINPDYIAVLAVYHDANETITGDMPTPVKYYNPLIKKAYKDIEAVSKGKLMSMLPDDMKEKYKNYFVENDSIEWKMIKAADKIAAYIKCIEEEKAGNYEFKKAGKSIKKEIEKFELPEAAYYMEKFIPPYMLSLDEL